VKHRSLSVSDDRNFTQSNFKNVSTWMMAPTALILMIDLINGRILCKFSSVVRDAMNAMGII